MFKKISLLMVAVLGFTMAGCHPIGEKITVEPAQVAKIISKDGYIGDIIPTSTFRLPPCFTWCEKVVRLDVSDQRLRENQSILMPQDKLRIDFEVTGVVSMNPNAIDPLFGKLPVDNNGFISSGVVYNTYARELIKTTVREYVTKYTIAELSSSLEKVNSDVYNLVKKEIESKTPFLLRTLEVGNIVYPKIITEAQENAAKRREQIQQEEAQLAISKVALTRELQEARLQRQIDLEKAQGEAAAQKLQAAVITDQVLELRRIENQSAWIAKWDGKQPTYSVTGGMSNDMTMMMPAPNVKN